MKSTLLCFGVIFVAMLACKKDSVQNNASRLTMIKDTGRVFRLEYNSNNQVTEQWIDSFGWWQNYAAITPVKFATYSYASNYVKASFGSGPGLLYNDVEYFFTNQQLPSSIITHGSNQSGSSVSVVETTNFYYKQNSNELDSVVTRGLYNIKYVPQYSNGNIVKCDFGFLPGPLSNTFHFTYNANPNPFRQAHPYLFIYVDPCSDNYSPTFLPMVFSTNAISSIVGYGLSSNVNLQITSDNKVEYEDWGYYDPYFRRYFYE